MNILVSSCLMGEKCRYDGNDNYRRLVTELSVKHTLIPVCPELLGGLSTPRNPAERKDSRVCMNDGTDVSVPFVNGAFAALEIAREHGCKMAILKAKSPSCGTGNIYDGTFSHIVTEGDGVCSEILQINRLAVFSDEQKEEIKAYLAK